MREAFGGTILFYVILGFLAVYIVFVGLIMNYAATYRASNYVLTSLEESEANVDLSTLKSNLAKLNYHNGLDVCCSNTNNGSVYSIKTYVQFDLPILDLDLKLKINNDTKTIYGVKCSDRIDYPQC